MKPYEPPKERAASVAATFGSSGLAIFVATGLVVFIADIAVMNINHDLGALAWLLNLPAIPVILAFYFLPAPPGPGGPGPGGYWQEAMKVCAIIISSLGWALVVAFVFRGWKRTHRRRI